MTDKMRIICPEGVVPGDMVAVVTPTGNEVNVEVPEGIKPGDEFEITYAAEESEDLPSDAANNLLEQRIAAIEADVKDNKGRIMRIAKYLRDLLIPGQSTSMSYAEDKSTGDEIDAFIEESRAKGGGGKRRTKKRRTKKRRTKKRKSKKRTYRRIN